jgi:hypothetical protein
MPSYSWACLNGEQTCPLRASEGMPPAELYLVCLVGNPLDTANLTFCHLPWGPNFGDETPGFCHLAIS